VRSWLYIPITVAAAAAITYAAMRALGKGTYAPELLAAALIAAVASCAALIPLLLARGASQPAVSQAGLVVTVLHMFLSLALGFAVYSLHWLTARTPFLIFLMSFYWLTLALLVVATTHAVRKAPPHKHPA